MYTHIATPSKIVCEVDGGKWLVHLLSTDNALMVNEGLVALAIVCSKHDRQINEKLAAANVVPDLLRVLGGQSVSGEVVSNGLALLLHLAQDGELMVVCLKGLKGVFLLVGSVIEQEGLDGDSPNSSCLLNSNTKEDLSKNMANEGSAMPDQGQPLYHQ